MGKHETSTPAFIHSLSAQGDPGLTPHFPVLQFGLITIFAAGFLLRPLFAVFNSWAEIQLDTHKFTCESWPPSAKQAEGIGICLLLLEALAHRLLTMNVSMGQQRGIQGQRGKWRSETGKGGLRIGKWGLNSRVRDREIEAGG